MSFFIELYTFIHAQRLPRAEFNYYTNTLDILIDIHRFHISQFGISIEIDNETDNIQSGIVNSNFDSCKDSILPVKNIVCL